MPDQGGEGHREEQDEQPDADEVRQVGWALRVDDVAGHPDDRVQPAEQEDVGEPEGGQE
jgi:hypothetical protein